MKLHWTDWAQVIALAGAAGATGCIAIWAALARAMRRAAVEKQQDTDRQLLAMATTVKALQARVAELSGPQATHAQQDETAAFTAPAEDAPTPIKEPLNPEAMAALAAAATAYLTRKARLGSAQQVPAEQDSAGAWAQQGRVFVQTSHNLRSRG